MVYPTSPTTQYVATEAAFILAIANTDNRIIRLTRSIYISAARTVPDNISVDTNGHMFYKSGSGTMLFYGELLCGRFQVFSGFAAGDIVGTFGSGVAFPEWWGLTTGYHDLAINKAVQASPMSTLIKGLTISLAGRIYSVSAPIDMSSRSCRLVGQGPGATELRTTANWTATWLTTDIFAAVTGGNHGVVVLIGSALGTGTTNSFFGSVEMLTVNCRAASIANPTRNISGISSASYVEEHSVIDKVGVTYATGCGIGFPSHYYSGAYQPAVINGLTISNFWVGGPMKRTSYGMYFTHWANNVTVSTGTVDMRLEKSVSSLYGTAGAPGGANATVYSAPDYIQDWPLIGMHLEGKIKVECAHIEGVGIACHMSQGAGPNRVTLDCVDGYVLMDSTQTYYNDGFGLSVAASPNTTYWAYGTVALIAKSDQAHASGTPGHNFKDSVSLTNVTSKGSCRYLLRDKLFGHEVSAYGHGATPATPESTVVSYTRGNGYINSTTGPAYDTPPYTTYDYTSPPVDDRVYFTGPVIA